MKPEQKETVRRFCTLTAGALTYGAEQVTRLAKCAYSSAKNVWDKHEDERAKIKARLLACKTEFVEFLESRGKGASDFDKILKRLEHLTEEELQKLKEILENL